MILLDTNLLIRMTDSTDPQCAMTRRAVHLLLSRHEQLIIFPQNLYEFWAVATRPVGGNGLGLSTAECQVELIKIKNLFRMVPDLPSLYDEWESAASQLR